ncbi:MAG: DNA primase [Candidatus Omnitrophica bacterium]|nr:DNA primase [Candidatus Omnitrophota bacterium]
MAISERIIEEIQAKSDIVEVLSRYIILKKLGRNYKTTCPFHNEKTPSFVVSPDKQIFHCFGCGAGGNVFSFVMKYENMQFPEAVELLAEKAGVKLPKTSRAGIDDSFADKLYGVNDLACRFFQDSLDGKPATKDYLASRGINEASLKDFRIGYAPDSWESLLNFFRSKSVEPKVLEKAGLVIPNDKGGYYDRFRNRAIFPIMDLRGRVLGFGARVLDSSLPKYINSPETMIYSKGKNLYGLNFSKEHIKKEKFALIVEGYLDFIIPYQAGVKNIIATLGTSLTTDQIRLLKRSTNTVIMVYDPDEAGETASLRNLDLFISEDVNVYIAELSEGLDPDSYIRKFGAEDFLKRVKGAKNIFEYKLDKLKAKFDIRSTNGKTAIVAAMLPTISRINNAVFRSELVKKLAERLSVDEEAIRSELKKVKTESYEPKYAPPISEMKRTNRGAELMLLALMLEGGKYIDSIKSRLQLDELKDTSVRDVVSVVFGLHNTNIEVTAIRLMTELSESPEGVRLVSEAASIVETITDKDKALSDCIAKIKKDNMKDKLDIIQQEIKSAHTRHDEEVVKKLVFAYNELVKVLKP